MTELTLSFQSTLAQAQLGAIAATSITASYYEIVTGQFPASDHPFIDSLQLALGEACTNSARHHSQVTPGEIKVVFVLKERQLEISIWDRNEAFDPSTIPLPDFDSFPENGYGLYLMRHCVDEVSFLRQGGWNVITLTKVISTET